ncbi:MAG: hypothetical protein P4L72_09105 [Parvibaculum sp.]|uniref:hypothetical protein n=1 Tax=Parvibaculum sp. TaxID=2024848 RepID=UPI00284771B1|nr:hypothetical protein [Parvibaculum sp.]MDR3499371.1 hypothetical protein [Parvibaculum sp.]
MEAKTNIRRLLAGSSFVALLAASNPANAAGYVYGGFNPGPITVNTNYDFVEVTGIIDGDLTLNSIINNTLGDAGFELNGGSIYGNVTNTNKITVSSATTTPAVGMLAHPNGFDFITGDLSNSGHMTITGKEAAAGILVYGTGVSIGGDISNSGGGNGFGMKVKASHSAQSGTAVAAGIFVDVPTVYGDVTNSGSVKVNASELSHVHQAATTDAFARGNALAYATGVGVGGHSSFQGLTTLSQPNIIEGSVVNEEGGVMLIKALAASTHTAIANGSAAGFGFATAFAGGTVDHKNAEAFAYGVYASANTIVGSVGNSGTIGVIALADSFNSAQAHGRHGTFPSINNGNAVATASGHAYATAAGAGASADLLVGDGFGGIFNTGILGAKAGATTTNIAKADTKAGTNAYARAYGAATAQATGLYDEVNTLLGSFVNGPNGEITSFATAISHNTATVTDPTRSYQHATAIASGGANAEAFGMRAGYGPYQTILGGIVSNGSIHASAMGNSYNTATVDVNGPATARALGTEDGSYATAVGVGFDEYVIGGNGGTGISYSGTIDAQAIANSDNHAKATGTSLATADARGYAAAYAAGTSGYVEYLHGGYLNKANVAVTALAQVHNQATAMAGTSLAHANALEYGSAYAGAVGLNPNIEFMIGDLVNGTGGSIAVHATAHVANTAKATGGTAGDAYAVAYGTAQARAAGIRLGSYGALSVSGLISNEGNIDVTAYAGVTNAVTATGGHAATALAYDGIRASYATAVGFGAAIDSLGGGFSNSGDIRAVASVNPVDHAEAYGGTKAHALAEGAGFANASGISLAFNPSHTVYGNIENSGHIDAAAFASGGNYAQASATNGYAGASVAGHVVANAAGMNIGGGIFLDGVNNHGSITAVAVAGSFNGGVLGDLFQPASISSLDANSFSSLTGLSFAHAGQGGAFATGTSLAGAYAQGYAGAHAEGVSVSANSVSGGIGNDGNVSVLAAAITTNQAHALDSGYGLAYAYAGGVGAYAHGTGISVGVSTVSGGISNSSYVGVAALAGSINVANAAGTSLGLHGTINARAFALGNAYADGVGIGAAGSTLGGGFTNSGNIGVIAGALAYNSAEALSSNGYAGAYAGNPNGVYASGSGISLGYSTVNGSVQNSGDIFTIGAALSFNKAVASGTSIGAAHSGLARAFGNVNANASGLYVSVHSATGEISNTGSITAIGVALAHNSASANADYASAYANLWNAQAQAIGFDVDAGTADSGISNSNDINAYAVAGTVDAGLAGILGVAVPNFGNTASAYGYTYAYAYANGHAHANAKGIDIYGNTIGYLPASSYSVDNSGDIHAGAVAGLHNIANATAQYNVAYAYAVGYGVDAQAVGIDVNGLTIAGGIHNSGQISVSAAGNTVNTANAIATGGGFATAVGSAVAAAYGIRIGENNAPSVGGSIVNDGSLINVGATAKTTNVATAQAGYATAYAGDIWRNDHDYKAVYAGAYANATGISAHVSTLGGSFTNNGAIQALASANSVNSAHATGDTYAYGYAYAIAQATALGIRLNATSIGGGVTNNGSLYIKSTVDSTANVTSKATGDSYGFGYASADAQGGQAEASAIGYDLNVGTLAGGFMNTTGGSMSVHATALQHVKAQSTGETFAFASASGAARADAYGLDLWATTLVGNFVNDGAITAVAHGSAVASALAHSNSGYAGAYAEVETAEAYASGIYVNFNSLMGGYTNNGTIIAKATADAKVVSSAVGAGALASAEGVAEAGAVGIGFYTDSMAGSFVNNATVWATGLAHADNQAIAKGSTGYGYAYASEGEPSETQASAYATGITAYINGTLKGDFSNNGAIHANARATSLVKATATGISSYGTAYSNAYARAIGVDLDGNGNAQVSSYGGHVSNSSSIHALAVALASATVAAMSGFAAASANARATGFKIHGIENVYGDVLNTGVSLTPAIISAEAYATAKAHSANAGVDLTAYANAEAVGLAVSLSGSLAGSFQNSGTIRGHAVANAVGTYADAHAYATGVSISTAQSIGGGILNSGTIEGTAAAHAVATSHGNGYGYAYALGLTVDVGATGIKGGISNTGSILANAIVDVTADFHTDPGMAFATALLVRVNGDVIGSGSTSLYNSGVIKAVASDPAHAYAKGVVLQSGSYAGNLSNVGTFSTEDGVFRSWTRGVIEADAHATVAGDAAATALLLENFSSGAASFSGALENSGLIKARAVSEEGEANATAIKLANGAYFNGGIVNTGVISAQATGTSSSTAVAINADQAGKGMVIQQIGQLDPSDKVVGGIFGEIRTNNGYNDQIEWSGGQIVGDIHGDTGDSLTVFGGLGYKTHGDYHFVYNNNINATSSDVFDGQRFGVVNVNDTLHAGTAVSLEVSGNLYLGALNVNHNGTLVVDSLTTKIDTTTLDVAGGSNVGGITWNLNNVLVANQGQPIIAAGTVDIGASAKTVAHMASNGLYKKNNDYYAIGVGNYGTDFTGTFGTLQNDFSTLYTVTDQYVTSGSEQGYHINVTRISFSDIPGITTDGTNFGNYLDQIVDYLSENDPNGPLATLLSQILTGNPADYAHGVNELSGHQNADMLLAALGNPSQLMDIIFGQLGGTGFGGSVFTDLGTSIQVANNSVSAAATDGGTPSSLVGANAGSSPVEKQISVWARAFGNWASLDRNAGIGAAGFTSNGGGAVIGGDYKVNDNFKAGLAGGYQRDNVDFHGAGKSDITTWSLSAYARGEQGPLYVNGLLGYAYQDYSLDRYYQPIVPGTVYTAHRSPSGGAYYAGAEVGYDYDLGSQAKLEPFLGFLYSHTKVDGSTETGSGPANLTVSDQSANSASSRLGLRWSQTFGSAGSSTWTPMLELGWKHEFADSNPSTTAALAGIPGASFTVQGAGVPKDSAIVGAGLTMKLSDALDGTVQYNGDFSDKYTDSTASLMLRLKF